MSTINNVPEDVLSRIQKLLQLASKNPNEAEAAAAMAKAQEYLTEYNLDTEAVQGVVVGSGAREKAAVDGGFYKFEQHLWEAVAHLNFCMYWHERTTRWSDQGGRTKKLQYDWDSNKYIKKPRSHGYDHNHRLVGRKVNVAATKAMAGYLRQVVERLTLDRIRGANDLPQYGQWANSYRHGVVRRICEKLQERRQEILAAEHAQKAMAEQAAQGGVSTSRALSLSVFIDKETDANLDFLYGEGYSAKRAAQAAEARAKHAAYVQWAKDHPEEAAAEAETRRQAARKSRYRGGRQERDNLDHSAFWAGYEDSKSVSIDPQMDTRKPAGLL